MYSTMKLEKHSFLEPTSSDKCSTVIDNAKLSSKLSSCLENGGYAEKKRPRPSAHYESFSLEEPEDPGSSMVMSNPSVSDQNSLWLKTEMSRRNFLMKSASLPNPENNACDLPDPFPELSQECLAPISARMYSSENSASPPNSPEQQVERKTTRIGAALPPTTPCGCNDNDVIDDIITRCPQNKITVDIYVSAQKFYSVEVDDNTTVASVCDHLDKITRSKRDPFWTIVEHVNKFNMERNLEDHELLIPIVKSWNSAKNHLFFRRDFCRYELYSNPNQCFPEQMLDVKIPKEESTSFMTRNELYRNLLLKCLLANQSLPDIQGYLHLREGKKGWKKYFCVLRHSGLYYVTKGCVKDSQRMVLLSDLTNDNIYIALNSKKTFGAPTQYCFCLAPSDDPSDKSKLLQFCAEDEQSRLCWVTGIRFFKFGDQLHENCRTFISCNSSQKENTVGERINGCSSKICDKVVVNPVIKVPNQEECRKSYQSNRHTCPWLQKSIPRVTESSSVHSFSSVLQASNSNPQNLEWFHDSIGRDEAVSILCNSGLKEGTFLVRHSQSLAGVYVLSFVHDGTVKHCTIHKIKQDDGWYYSLDGGSTKFMDLAQLIDFYRLNAGRLPTRLVCHVTRLC